jgi:hypothetical protein
MAAIGLLGSPFKPVSVQSRLDLSVKLVPQRSRVLVLSKLPEITIVGKDPSKEKAKVGER